MDQNDSSGTVVITGASGGMGAAFARHLAAEGRRLILVARRPEPLDELAGELRSAHGAVCEVVSLDLAVGEDVAEAELLVSGVPDLAVLINAAGFGTSRRFAETELESQCRMIALHVVAPTRLCRAVLPRMISRGSGAIINVSSLTAEFPLPGNVTYSGTKAYLKVFSEALQTEVGRHGIRVQALCPGLTHTGFHDTAEFRGFKRSSFPAWLWSTPEEVVAASLRSLRRGQVVCVPGIGSQLTLSMVRLGLGPLLIRQMYGRRRSAPGTAK